MWIQPLLLLLPFAPAVHEPCNHLEDFVLDAFPGKIGRQSSSFAGGGLSPEGGLIIQSSVSDDQLGGGFGQPESQLGGFG